VGQVAVSPAWRNRFCLTCASPPAFGELLACITSGQLTEAGTRSFVAGFTFLPPRESACVLVGLNPEEVSLEMGYYDDHLVGLQISSHRFPVSASKAEIDILVHLRAELRKLLCGPPRILGDHELRAAAHAAKKLLHYLNESEEHAQVLSSVKVDRVKYLKPEFLGGAFGDIVVPGDPEHDRLVLEKKRLKEEQRDWLSEIFVRIMWTDVNKTWTAAELNARAALTKEQKANAILRYKQSEIKEEDDARVRLEFFKRRPKIFWLDMKKGGFWLVDQGLAAFPDGWEEEEEEEEEVPSPELQRILDQLAGGPMTCQQLNRALYGKTLRTEVYKALVKLTSGNGVSKATGLTGSFFKHPAVAKHFRVDGSGMVSVASATEGKAKKKSSRGGQKSKKSPAQEPKRSKAGKAAGRGRGASGEQWAAVDASPGGDGGVTRGKGRAKGRGKGRGR